MRAIFQPVLAGPDGPTPADGAIHVFYGMPRDELVAFFDEILALKDMHGAHVTYGTELGPHPILAATGLDGTATITSATDSGVLVGANKLFNVQMTVNVPGKAPYQETSAAMVPPDDVGKVVAGLTVPVKVAADNPNLVMIQWDKV